MERPLQTCGGDVTSHYSEVKVNIVPASSPTYLISHTEVLKCSLTKYRSHTSYISIHLVLQSKPKNQPPSQNHQSNQSSRLSLPLRQPPPPQLQALAMTHSPKPIRPPPKPYLPRQTQLPPPHRTTHRTPVHRRPKMNPHPKQVLLPYPPQHLPGRHQRWASPTRAFFVDHERHHRPISSGDGAGPAFGSAHVGGGGLRKGREGERGAPGEEGCRGGMGVVCERVCGWRE